MTLAEFLDARIAEDEAVAREAGLDDPHWRYNTENWGGAQIESLDGTNITYDREGLSDSVQDFAGPHIARHDPARVLAECEARRRLVERCRPRYAIWYRESDRLIAEGFSIPTVPTVAHSDAVWPFAEAEAILRDLAAIYADHPDYAEAWR